MFIFYLHGYARSHNLLCQDPFYLRREDKHLNWAGIEPGSPCFTSNCSNHKTMAPWAFAILQTKSSLLEIPYSNFFCSNVSFVPGEARKRREPLLCWIIRTLSRLIWIIDQSHETVGHHGRRRRRRRQQRRRRRRRHNVTKTGNLFSGLVDNKLPRLLLF